MKNTLLHILSSLLWFPHSEEPVTLNYHANDIQLKEIFSMIKKQTGYVFFYDASLLINAKHVTIHWENKRLHDALNELFKEQSLSWMIEGKTITFNEEH